MSRPGSIHQAWISTMGHNPVKKYRVAGTFSFFPEGSEEEKLREIDTTIVASSKDEAAEKALEDYEIQEQEPSWLFGYPTVEFLGDVHAGPTLRDYWTKAR